MASTRKQTLNKSDVQTLRALARRVREISQDPIMEERRRLWLKHNSLRGERPMILAETGGVLDELIPVSQLRCQEDWARNLERGLLNTIFVYEHVKDDSVVEPIITWNWRVNFGDYGVKSTRQTTTNDGKLASYRWEPAIRDLRAEFDRLRPRTFSVDREASLDWKATLEEVFGGILDVRRRGAFWWTVGMTWTAIDLIGLENLMLYMYDQPDMLHKLMAFLRDDHLAMLDFVEKENLLSLNNRNDYIGSGSLGYSLELPPPGTKATDPVRVSHLWGLSESQETVGVGPKQFAEFILPYQKPVIERFGLAYYGCCEPVHSRWEAISTIRNLRKVSVSPWADQQLLGKALAGKYIFCRKPNPALISSERFDEDEIRADLRATMKAAAGCHIEIVMKDVHTVANQPWRLGRWVEIAREVSRH